MMTNGPAVVSRVPRGMAALPGVVVRVADVLTVYPCDPAGVPHDDGRHTKLVMRAGPDINIGTRMIDVLAALAAGEP